MGEIDLTTVHKDLETVKRLVIEMKEHMEDCFLTAEEEIDVERAREEFRNKETVSLEDLELKKKHV